MTLFAILNALDLLSTWLGGLHNEMNPAMAYVIAQHGFSRFVIGKILLAAYFCVSLVLMQRMRFPFWKIYRAVCIGIYVAVVAWNIAYLVIAWSVS